MFQNDRPRDVSSEESRSGYVTLLGRPNAGKSTLMNALIGERLSIVTPKAQTTWRRVTGILTTAHAQMIFLDTPGLLEPRDLLQKSMLSAAMDALREADVILLVLDPTSSSPAREGKDLPDILREAPGGTPLLAAVNKIDRASDRRVAEFSSWAEDHLSARAFPVSALQGRGIDHLRRSLEEALPPGPHLYPPDEIARDPVRFFVAEIVRESVFETFYEEIPYSTFCQIEEFREREDPVYIEAHLFVERNSQKRILIGKGGSSIRSLGSISRRKIEGFLGRRVYLSLWVKVLPNWRRKRGHLKKLGFSVPDSRELGR